MREGVKRNFILQQGFEEPASCPLQYGALQFQPRIILVWLLVGSALRSAPLFYALCAVLWWGALFPKLNLFEAVYNSTLGRRPGALRLTPAPAPRRTAQAMAGAFALASAELIHFGLSTAACVVQAIF